MQPLNKKKTAARAEMGRSVPCTVLSAVLRLSAQSLPLFVTLCTLWLFNFINLLQHDTSAGLARWHSLQCCRPEGEIRHQNKRHFLGAGTKVTMECVQKYCLNKRVRHNNIILFFRHRQQSDAVHSVICTSPCSGVAEKASSQHYSGLQRCGTCHEL